MAIRSSDTSADGMVPAISLGLVSLMLVAAWLLPVAAPRSPLPGPLPLDAGSLHPRLTVHGPRFTPAPPEPEYLPRPSRDLDAEVARLGRLGPRYHEPVRAKYAGARDLHALLGEILPDAAAGERASQYHVYLVLSRCQAYLRMQPEEARELGERVLLSMNERPGEEREHWEREHWGCQAFAGADLAPVRAAMGSDTPGAEIEYSSIWFERALRAGYPPALAEAALRINLLSVGERIALLEEAALSADPDVFWQLFLSSPGGSGEPISTGGLAWLVLACRGGQDCSDRAEWFSRDVCLQWDCNPGESALEHFWYSTDEAGRRAAWELAGRIERRLAAGVPGGLPWPDLAKRNIYANRFERARGGG